MMLTVILPSLNVVQYIKQSLDSVINQSYKELDIICVDAGSTDGTLDIINEYAKIDSRIRIINCPEKSYGKQVNMAMDIAIGKYVAIVDTDDFISINMYDNLIKIAEMYNLDYVKGNYIEYYQFEDDRVYQQKKSIISEMQLYNYVINPKEYPQLHCQDGYLWSGIYNLDFLKNNSIVFNTTSGAAFQDVGFFHQVTYYAKRVMFIESYGYYYRIARVGNSISSPNGLKYMLQEYNRLINQELIPQKDTIQWEFIYKKMLLSFVAECDKKPIYSAFETDVIKPYLEDAIKIMKECINNSFIRNDAFDNKYWNKVYLLLDNPKKYAYYQTKKANSIKMLIDICKKHIVQSVNEGRIAVFGCGIRGRRLKELLMKNGINVNEFIDNNVQKIGNVIDGIDVISLKEEKSKNVLYLIAVKNYEEDIVEQLINEGIKKEKIYILDSYFWE